MKKYLLLVLSIVVILTTIILQTTSFADDDDFEVSYDFFPQLVGSQGGEVKLTVDIKNTGSTNINWVDVLVNNTAIFSKRSTVTITPDTTRTLSFLIPFESSDLNVDRILQVSMSNDVANNPNGVKMFNFQIQGTDDIFDVSASISPVKSQYQPGDTITVTHTFTNRITTHATTQTASTTYLSKGSSNVYTHPETVHGNVFPGNTISNSFVYTLQQADVGHIKANYVINFKLMGKEYSFEASTIEFDVVPLPDINFNANLSASPTEINPGDTVTFTVNLQNTSSTSIDNFEIRNSEGGVMASTESLAAGASGSVSLSANINESTDVSYVVVARIGTRNATKETNVVHITVRTPATPTPEPTPVPETPVPAGDPTPTATATLVPTITLINTDENSTPAIALSGEPTTSPAPPANNKKNSDTSFLLVMIIIILILLIAGVVGIGLMLFNKNGIDIFKKKSNTRNLDNKDDDNHDTPYK